MESTRFEFGPFTLDADRGLLTRDGAPVDAGHRAVLLLQALLRAEGETVCRLGRVVKGEGVIYKGALL